ncbi:hypothetical protein, partial [Klebsiella pneumoniae]|uniref:hypothetical protein n=1 Tax=Klebsiella pneumoniae TaxID=573 RepID=UPI001F29E706
LNGFMCSSISKRDDKFITTDYLQQCLLYGNRAENSSAPCAGAVCESIHTIEYQRRAPGYCGMHE